MRWARCIPHGLRQCGDVHAAVTLAAEVGRGCESRWCCAETPMRASRSATGDEDATAAREKELVRSEVQYLLHGSDMAVREVIGVLGREELEHLLQVELCCEHTQTAASTEGDIHLAGPRSRRIRTPDSPSLASSFITRGMPCRTSGIGFRITTRAIVLPKRCTRSRGQNAP